MPIKILVLINTLTSISSYVYSNHIEFFITSKKLCPDVSFIMFTPHRMSIDRARNEAAKKALQLECQYLLFIDDDVLLPRNTLELLLEADKDIVAGLVMIRGFPFNVMAFKLEDDEEHEGEQKLGYFNNLPVDEDEKLVELAECDAVGFSCCLIKIGLFQAMIPPYFVSFPNMTEDVFFCGKAKKTLDPEPKIFVHTGVQCGHLMSPEPIEWGVKEMFQEFYTKLELKETEEMEKAMKLAGIVPSDPPVKERTKDYIQRSLRNL
jgi:hypothetical protein